MNIKELDKKIVKLDNQISKNNEKIKSLTENNAKAKEEILNLQKLKKKYLDLENEWNLQFGNDDISK